MIELPYTSIGIVTVEIILAIFLEITVVAVLVALYIAWYKSLTFSSNCLWRGYDPTEKRYPPAWKLKISGVLIAIRDFDFLKIPSVLREAEEMADGGLD